MVLWLDLIPTLAFPAPAGLADLIRRDVLRWHKPGIRLPGEVGSGYRSGANLEHIEPEEIFILGTSHVSQRSADDVERAIRILQPDAVVIECCRSRIGMLYADEAQADDRASNPFGLSGDGPLKALRRSLSLGGWAPLLLRVLLVRMSESTVIATDASDRNVAGADLRAARQAASTVNATLILGDRPVEITLERAWRALSWQERWSLMHSAASVLKGGGGLAMIDRRAAAAEVAEAEASEARRLFHRALGDEGGSTAARDAIAEMEAVLAASYPSLVAPLIRERDIYLSLTLKSSKAVSGRRRVLGVVGRGHLDGVCRALREDHAGAFKTLTWTPSRAVAKQRWLGVPRPIVTRLAMDAAFATSVWVWWQQAAGAVDRDGLVLEPARMGDFTGSALDIIWNNFALEGAFLLPILLALIGIALGDPKRKSK